MEKFKNGTKKLNIADADGMDIYTISEKDGKKYIRMNGWFYLNDEGTHSTSVTFEEMPVEEFIKHKAINAFGYDKFISDIIDCGKQYIIDYSEEACSDYSKRGLETGERTDWKLRGRKL